MRGIPIAMVAFAVQLGVLGCGKAVGHRTEDRSKAASSAAQPDKRPAIGGGPSEYDGGSPSTDTTGTGATGSSSTGSTGTGTAGSTGSTGTGSSTSDPGSNGDTDDNPRYEWT